MRATYVVVVAFLLLIVGRWAHGKPAFTLATVAAAVFIILVIALLDHGGTEEIARGIAWILLAVAALNKDSPITAVANVINETRAKATGNPTPSAAQQAIGRGGPNA